MCKEYIFVLIFIGVYIIGFIVALVLNKLRFRKRLKELKSRYSEFNFSDPILPWERI